MLGGPEGAEIKSGTPAHRARARALWAIFQALVKHIILEGKEGLGPFRGIAQGLLLAAPPEPALALVLNGSHLPSTI